MPPEVRVRARAGAGLTGAEGARGAVRGGAPERARTGWRAREAAEGGGWWEPRATSPAPLRRVRAGVRAPPPGPGEGGGGGAAEEGGVGGGGARGALRSLLPRSRRRRRSAAAAPAAILGSLCGGGDDPRLGCGTRLPSVSPAEPHAFPFSSLAFPPVRSPAGRLLTGGRDPPWTTGAEEPGGGRPLFPTCLHSHLWASASDTRKRCWLHMVEIPVFCGTQFCKIFLGFLGNNTHL